MNEHPSYLVAYELIIVMQFPICAHALPPVFLKLLGGTARLSSLARPLTVGARYFSYVILFPKGLKSPVISQCCSNLYNVGPPPSDVSWFITPSNYSYLGTINHSYWSYKPT